MLKESGFSKASFGESYFFFGWWLACLKLGIMVHDHFVSLKPKTPCLWELMKLREFLFGRSFCFTENHWIFWVGRNSQGSSSPNLEWMTQMEIESTAYVISTMLQPMELTLYLYGNIKEEGLVQWAGKTNSTPQNSIVTQKSCSLLGVWMLKR